MSEERTAFEVYRDRVDRPLTRLFKEYGVDEIRWFVVGMAANVVARLSGLIPPFVLGVAIDAVFTGEAAYTLPLVPSGWLPTGQTAQFWLSAGLIVGAFGVTAVFTWIYGVAANNFAHRVMHAVRTDSFERMQRLDMTFFDDKQTGEVMSVLNNDASNLEVFLDNALQNSARLGVMLLGIAGLLCYLNPGLATVTLVSIPVMVVFTLWFMRAVEPRYVDQRSSVGDLNTVLENALTGVELVKTSDTEAYESDRVETASFEYFRRTMAVLKLNFVYRPGMELLAGVAFVLTFVVGGVWLFEGPPRPFTTELRVGTFVTFLFMTQQFVAPMAEVSNIVDQYENAKASSERVLGLRDIPIRIADPDEHEELAQVDGRVEYDGVSFAYPETPLQEPGNADETVTNDVSFTAAAGETVALVGPTGAGKSTLVKLLLRLYDVSDGTIRLDGHDIRDIRLSDLRSAVGYVSQEGFLFDGTVAENIRYGEYEQADDAPSTQTVRQEIIEAAKAAEAHQFISSLPNGYDTRIGEEGVKLSGGQRQRVAIARTVLQDPEILILDEATSAVDTETEMLIQRSLDRLSADRTAFVIAHRLSTIRDADTVLVLEDGAIVERGDHETLLADDGLYAKLWGVQAGEIDSLPDEFIAEARERQMERGVVSEVESEMTD